MKAGNPFLKPSHFLALLYCSHHSVALSHMVVNSEWFRTCLAYESDCGGVKLTHSQFVPVHTAEPPEGRDETGYSEKING